jgi:hypothetical protein
MIRAAVPALVLAVPAPATGDLSIVWIEGDPRVCPPPGSA